MVFKQLTMGWGTQIKQFKSRIRVSISRKLINLLKILFKTMESMHCHSKKKKKQKSTNLNLPTTQFNSKENHSDSVINSKGFGEFSSSKIQGSGAPVAYSQPKIHRIPLAWVGEGGGELGYIGKESMCPNKSVSTSFQVKRNQHI